MMWLGLAAVATASFAWEAPPRCPSAEAVERDIRKLAADAWPHPRISIRVRVTESPWSAEMRVHWPQGSSSRTFRGESCQAIAEAVAVVVAIAVSELAEEVPARQPLPGRITVQPIRVRWPSRAWLGVALGPSWGSLPGTALQIRARGEFNRPLWSLIGEGWIRTSGGGEAFDVSYDAEAYGGAVGACAGPSWHRLTVRGCALFELGSQRFTSDQGVDALRLWWAPGLDLTLAWAFTHWMETRVAVEGRIQGNRPGLQVDLSPGENRDLVTVYRSEVAALAASLGFFVRF